MVLLACMEAFLLEGASLGWRHYLGFLRSSGF